MKEPMLTLLRPSRFGLAFLLVTLALLARGQYAVVSANAAVSSTPSWDDPLTIELDDLDGLLCHVAVYSDAMGDSRRDIATGLAPTGVVAFVDTPGLHSTFRSSEPTRGPPLAPIRVPMTV